MTREEARQEIRQRIPVTNYLEKSKGKFYCCPDCGSGHGPNGTGAVQVDTKRNLFTCHACHYRGDVIDLYQKRNGVDYNTALSLLAQELNIEIDPFKPETGRSDRHKTDLNEKGNIIMPEKEKPVTEAVEAPEIDLTDYYRKCRAQITAPAAVSYLSARGISTETAVAYCIGFDPAADPAQSGHPSPRIIIPTSKGHYIGRSIDPDTPKAYQKMNNKGGTPAIFNLRVLYTQDVREVFVTEGAFDALSILETGADAIALNSTSNVPKLIEILQKKRTAATLILCLDNDNAGRSAAEDLKAELQRLNISYIEADICGKFKDPNEALASDRKSFTEAVKRAQHETAAKPDSVSYYIDNLMAADIDRFKAVKKTGFLILDKETGGLYPGLYAVAAISSLGKTTFCHQIADQIAAAGDDVLFFSLEQSRLELVSKSLSRRTYQNDRTTAKESLKIRRGDLSKPVLDAAAQYKREVQDRISIIEGNFACNISFIGNYVRKYIKRTGTRPVIFIDYLQILQPEQNGNRVQSVREAVDNSVTELKRISRELDLTIFVVCSVNRANYLAPIDFESLKESGGIEYTCDVIWGLQLQCLKNSIFNDANKIKEKRERIREAKKADPRKIELVCLKNRYGISSFSCYFNYYPRFDTFTESTPDISTEPKKAGRRL